MRKPFSRPTNPTTEHTESAEPAPWRSRWYSAAMRGTVGAIAGTAFSAWITAGHDHVTPFDAETLKLVLDRLCAEAGVKVLCHATFVGPVLKGDAAKGAVVLTRKGLEQIDAEMVIDAPGDGDVAAAAGVPSEYGNPEIGKVQPATLFFRINCVDSKRLEADVMAHIHEFRKVDGVSYRALHWWVAKAEEAGEWDIARKSVNIYRGVREDEWAVNCTRIANVDATDSESLSAGEVEILVTLREGEAACSCWGCDLTYDYVKINGDYRS